MVATIVQCAVITPLLGQLPSPASPATDNVAVDVRGTPQTTAAQTVATPRVANPETSPVVLWTFHTSGTFSTAPVVMDDKIYVGADDGFVYLVDSETGTATWGVNSGGRVQAPPTVFGGTVYIANGDFTTLDALSGRPLLQITSDRKRLTGVVVGADVAISAGARRSQGFVEAISLVTSAHRWRIDLTGPVVGSPVFSGGTVFVGSVAGEVLAIDPSTGLEHWSAQVDGPIYVAPLVVDDTVFVASWKRATSTDGARPGIVMALDANNGNVIWRRTVSGPVRVPLVTRGTAIYAVGQSWIYALDRATGSVDWRVRSAGEIVAEPLTTSNLIIVGNRMNEVVAIDRRTAEEQWRFDTAYPIVAVSMGHGQVVYLTNRDRIAAVLLPIE